MRVSAASEAGEVMRVARTLSEWSTMRRGGATLTQPVTEEEWPRMEHPNGREWVAARRKRSEAAANRDAYHAGLKRVVLVRSWGDVLHELPVDPAPFRVHMGDRAVFPSKSAPGGTRVGTVVEESPTRVCVAYKFQNGRATTKWVRRIDVEPCRMR